MDLEIEHIQKENITALKAASGKLESIEKEFNEVKTSVDSKKNGQNCELFIAMKKNKEKIETLKKQLNKLSNERRIQRYTVLPSTQIESMMITITEICRMTAARFHAGTDVRTSKDKHIPDIRGLTTVHGHYCVVTDNNNMSVKVVDTRNRCVTTEIGIDGYGLYGLTTVKHDCVAVPVFLKNCRSQIQFFSVSSSGVITSTAKQFDVEFPCRDLEYCNDKLFLIQKNQIQIFNMKGQKELNTIELDSAGVAESRDDVWSISLSQDVQTIYVTDRVKHSVTSVTLDGNVKAVYTDKGLKEPWGITVDKDGYVYVYSTDTRSIHQLTADLSRGQIIIEDVSGLRITFSGTENKLYLSDGIWVMSTT